MNFEKITATPHRNSKIFSAPNSEIRNIPQIITINSGT